MLGIDRVSTELFGTSLEPRYLPPEHLDLPTLPRTYYEAEREHRSGEDRSEPQLDRVAEVDCVRGVKRLTREPEQAENDKTADDSDRERLTIRHLRTIQPGGNNPLRRLHPGRARRRGRRCGGCTLAGSVWLWALNLHHSAIEPAFEGEVARFAGHYGRTLTASTSGRNG